MSNAVKHWKIQRYTAIMNLFIALWLAISLLCIQGNSYEAIIKWLKYPVNSIMISLFFITSFLHMRLGLQVVIEDYVSKILLRKRLIIGINSLSWILIIISIGSVLKIVIFN